jgi:hypothetical protein
MVRLLAMLVWAAIVGVTASGRSAATIGVFMDVDAVPGAGLIEIMKNRKGTLLPNC